MEEKFALVTGASRGIGKSIAIKLAKNGYTVGVNYFKHKNEAENVCNLIDKLGGTAISLFANVSKIEDIEKMFNQFFDTFPTINLLVNNAGVSMFAPFLKVSEKMWNVITNIDWKGTYFCTQHAARKMVENGTKGVIINMSSNQKDGCWPTASVYGPIKATIDNFTRHIAYELSPYGIRAVAIAPGYTDVGWPKNDPIFDVIQKLPLKRFATPDEIAEIVLFLASEKASYITGTCLTVDGGALLPIVTENDLNYTWESTNH